MILSLLSLAYSFLNLSYSESQTCPLPSSLLLGLASVLQEWSNIIHR